VTLWSCGADPQGAARAGKEVSRIAARQRSLGVRLLPILIGLAAIAFTMVRGCQEGPFGRRQIVALNPQQEAALGAQAFQQVVQQADVVPDGPVVRAVQRVAKQLIEATEKPDLLDRLKLSPQQFRWELRVVRSREANAFCLPGGKIVVYTGILSIAETESGLATVLAHEIGHALAHHGAERMAQDELVNIAATAAAGSIQDLEPEKQRQILVLLGAGAKFGVLLPYSRRHESEADHIGLLLMSEAGYDPHAAVKFWRRMSQQMLGGQPPQFMSTHPSHEHRVQDLEGWQEQAMEIYQRVETHPPDHRLPLNTPGTQPLRKPSQSPLSRDRGP
jgi:metalloendopeptidase OMA1, mitochondrial